MLKINNKDTKMTPTYLRRCSSVSIINFEQVNAGWAICESTFQGWIQIFQLGGTQL